MQTRFFCAWLIICFAAGWLPGIAVTASAETAPEVFEFESNINILYVDLAGITLGDDPLIDHRIDDEITLDFEMNYQLSDRLFVFLGGSFFDENETLNTSNLKSSESGFEREQTGIGYLWGEDTEFEFTIGRLEYTDERQWWWDEFLDSIRLQIDQDDLSFLLAHGRELGRSRSNLDFIGPEEEGINRSLAQLEWDISDNQQLAAYYLRQADRSASYTLNDSLDENRTDAEDANLRWLGLAYLSQISDDSLGDIEFMLGYTRLKGNSTLYEISAPVGNLVTVDAIDRFDIEASATEVSINWVPEFNPDLKFIASRAQGSGDRNPSDSRIETFRQTGLHGNEADFFYYGELYQPELSNIRIESIGVGFEGIDRFTIALMRHKYRQDELDTEMRDVAIDLDTNGINRNLGTEIDLIIQYEALDGLDFKFIGAEFKAGRAYGIYAGEKSRYWSVEMDYRF